VKSTPRRGQQQLSPWGFCRYNRAMNEMSPNPSLDAFRALVSLPDDDIDLAHAAAVAVLYEFPDFDTKAFLAQLDHLAERVLLRSGGSTDVLTQIQALLQELFSPLGLHLRGARDNAQESYYDPYNSFPHTVLERKRGIPIALAILMISVGARAGIALGGTRMPLHFLVRVLGVRPPLLIDCYEGGHLLNIETCRETLRILSQERIQFQPDMAELIPNTDILTRYLNNLKLIYYDEARFVKAAAVLDRLIILSPESPELARERGLIYFRLGRREDSRRDLESYLDLAVDAADADEIRNILKRIE
jgi:regulator of sirC expression with transglutaminase-like and TPR domain